MEQGHAKRNVYALMPFPTHIWAFNVPLLLHLHWSEKLRMNECESVCERVRMSACGVCVYMCVRVCESMSLLNILMP